MYCQQRASRWCLNVHRMATSSCLEHVAGSWSSYITRGGQPLYNRPWASLSALLLLLLLLLLPPPGHQSGLAAASALGAWWLPAGHRHATIHTRGAS
jgi:hypothetical protein